MEEVFEGQAAVVITPHEVLFGYVDHVNYDSHEPYVCLSGGNGTDEQWESGMYTSHPHLYLLEYSPATLAVMIDLSLATGNQEDFIRYTDYLRDWNELLKVIQQDHVIHIGFDEFLTTKEVESR